MDAQGIIDTATTANAVSLGNGIATELFRDSVKNTYKITTNLKTAERQYLKRIIPFNVMFTATTTMTHDHAMIGSLRNLARDVYERTFTISKTNERTLVVGSSAREIRLYNSNVNIHHYVYCGENKDVDRIIKPVLSDIVSKLKQKAAKTDRRVYMPHPDKMDPTKMRPVVKRYFEMRQIFDDYVSLNKLPNTIHTEPVECNTLLFEDSIYNFTPKTLTELFNTTKAQLGYGYAFLPMELLYPELPENRMYIFQNLGDESQVTFRHGTSNGYRHNTEAWAMLLKNPVIAYKGTQIMVEIVSRIGCMCVFKLIRSTRSETIVRTVGLTEVEAYVKILDLQNMYDPITDSLKRPLIYVSVRESEFYVAVNWTLTMVSEKFAFKNVANFVRRRMNGLSMVTAELVAPWDLPKSQVFNFSLVVLLYVETLMEGPGQMVDREKLEFPGFFKDKKLRMQRWLYTTLQEKFSLLHSLLYRFRIQDKLMLTPDDQITQVSRVIPKRSIEEARARIAPSDDGGFGVFDAIERVIGRKPQRGDVNVGLYCDHTNEEDLPSCDICLELYGQLGEQIVECRPKNDDETTHQFSLTLEQLGHLKTTLLDSDGDAPGIREVKKRALENLPKAAFSRRAKVHYIKAGPGCGKSYIIRKLANENDLVIALFTKLKTDYEKLKTADGTMYDLAFKTTHRAMETRGYNRIFVDEFTSFPYEILACVINNNAAAEVFLVGDEKQTRIIEPEEGLYIGNRIDLGALYTHELLVNFRNPPDTVALLNKLFGYKMRAGKVGDGRPSIVFKEVADGVDNDKPVLQMCFSTTASKRYTEVETNTVRANQGGTFSDCRLYVSAEDKNSAAVECLQVVALSRHTNTLEICCDGSTTAEKFKSLIGDTIAWQNCYSDYLKFDKIETTINQKSDPIVTKILGTEKEFYNDTESEISDVEVRKHCSFKRTEKNRRKPILCDN